MARHKTWLMSLAVLIVFALWNKWDSAWACGMQWSQKQVSEMKWWYFLPLLRLSKCLKMVLLESRCITKALHADGFICWPVQWLLKGGAWSVGTELAGAWPWTVFLSAHRLLSGSTSCLPWHQQLSAIHAFSFCIWMCQSLTATSQTEPK